MNLIDYFNTRIKSLARSLKPVEGISNVHDVFILFVKDGQVYLSLHEKEVKKYLRDNIEKLDYTFGGEDGVGGYFVNLSKLLPLKLME